MDKEFRKKVSEEVSSLDKEYLDVFLKGMDYINSLPLSSRNRKNLTDKLSKKLLQGNKNNLTVDKIFLKDVYEFIDKERSDFHQETSKYIIKNLFLNIFVFLTVIVLLNGLFNLFRLGQYAERPEGLFLIRLENIFSPLITLILLGFILPILTRENNKFRKFIYFLGFILVSTLITGLLFGILYKVNIDVSKYIQVPVGIYLLILIFSISGYYILKKRD